VFGPRVKSPDVIDSDDEAGEKDKRLYGQYSTYFAQSAPTLLSDLQFLAQLSILAVEFRMISRRGILSRSLQQCERLVAAPCLVLIALRALRTHQ
jgi:hypothetical protein